MNCLACNKTVARGELINCTACRGLYHYACLGMTSAYYDTHRAELIKAWKCHSCVNITRRRNDSTPIRNQFELLRDDVNMSCDDLQLNNSDAPQVQPRSITPTASGNKQSNANSGNDSDSVITYAQFALLLDTKLDSLRSSVISEMNSSIRKEISGAIDRLRSEFTETTDYLAAEQKDFKLELQNAHLKVTTLEAESSRMHSEMTDLKKRLTTLEKASRSRNLEIQMLPERQSENLVVMVKQLCNAMKTQINDSDICAVRRIAKVDTSSKRPRTVLLTLPSERHRDVILSAYKRYNKANKNEPLNSKLLELPGQRHIIYLAEHLAPDCKSLHAATRKWVKEQDYKFVWVKYGRVYVRKNESSSAIVIRDTACLDKLCKAQ